MILQVGKTLVRIDKLKGVEDRTEGYYAEERSEFKQNQYCRFGQGFAQQIEVNLHFIDM